MTYLFLVLKSCFSKLQFLMNHLCMKYLFIKRERLIIFSALEKTGFLNLMLLLKFWIWWCSNILNLFNISMILNKCIIRWFRSSLTHKINLKGQKKCKAKILNLWPKIGLTYDMLIEKLKNFSYKRHDLLSLLGSS